MRFLLVEHCVSTLFTKIELIRAMWLIAYIGILLSYLKHLDSFALRHLMHLWDFETMKLRPSSGIWLVGNLLTVWHQSTWLSGALEWHLDNWAFKKVTVCYEICKSYALIFNASIALSAQPHNIVYHSSKKSPVISNISILFPNAEY